MAKYPLTPALREWLDNAPKNMAQLLADAAHTSTAMFSQWIHGGRGISAEKAGEIVDAMKHLAKDHKTAPKPLTRGDLCDTCRRCEYFLKHRK